MAAQKFDIGALLPEGSKVQGLSIKAPEAPPPTAPVADEGRSPGEDRAFRAFIRMLEGVAEADAGGSERASLLEDRYAEWRRAYAGRLMDRDRQDFHEFATQLVDMLGSHITKSVAAQVESRYLSPLRNSIGRLNEQLRELEGKAKKRGA